MLAMSNAMSILPALDLPALDPSVRSTVVITLLIRPKWNNQQTDPHDLAAPAALGPVFVPAGT